MTISASDVVDELAKAFYGAGESIPDTDEANEIMVNFLRNGDYVLITYDDYSELADAEMELAKAKDMLEEALEAVEADEEARRESWPAEVESGELVLDLAESIREMLGCEDDLLCSKAERKPDPWERVESALKQAKWALYNAPMVGQEYDEGHQQEQLAALVSIKEVLATIPQMTGPIAQTNRNGITSDEDALLYAEAEEERILMI